MLPNRHIPRDILGLADLRPEGVRVALQACLDGPIPVILVVEVVEAVHAVAHVAEFPVGEAVAVQLQALRLGAVAGLPRPHAVGVYLFLGGYRRGGLGAAASRGFENRGVSRGVGGYRHLGDLGLVGGNGVVGRHYHHLGARDVDLVSGYRRLEGFRGDFAYGGDRLEKQTSYNVRDEK